jgi:LuxR family transcriptional regulator, maltose regulon positive regulatory protein
MAQEGMPLVRDGFLYVAGEAPIRLGSARWFAWLRTAHHFSYYASGGYHLTLRQEKRRNGLYWYAYLKKARKLHNSYAGRSATLTPDRLAALLDKLLPKVEG